MLLRSPLRERAEDIPLLVDYFLRRFGGAQHGLEITPKAMLVLRSFAWPGNVRELQGALKYAMVNARSDVIVPDHFPQACRGGSTPPPPEADNHLDILGLVHRLLDAGDSEIFHKVQAEVDRVVLEAVLNRVDGNQVEAARWVRDHLPEDARVLCRSPGLLKLYAGREPPSRFVAFTDIEADSWPDILDECRRKKIEYIIWHDQLLQRLGDYYARKYRTARFDILKDPAEAGGVIIERRYANYPNLVILRVETADEPTADERR